MVRPVSMSMPGIVKQGKNKYTSLIRSSNQHKDILKLSCHQNDCHFVHISCGHFAVRSDSNRRFWGIQLPNEVLLKRQLLIEFNKFYSIYSKLDESLSQLTGFFGVRDIPWGSDVPQWRRYCRLYSILGLNFFLILRIDRSLSKASTQATEIANNCIGGLSSTIISVTALKATRLNRSIYCKNRKIMQKAIDHGKCGNFAKNDTIKCWVNMIDMMVNLKRANTSDKIPGICW
jgi:hypothetical protein